MGSLDPDVDMKQEFDDSGYVQDDTGSKAVMEEYRGSANLLDLSDDVLLYILKNLSAHDLKALGFTCVRLGALVVDHTLWVDVDGRDVPHGCKRVRWMLMRVLGPHTRSLRLTGYAEQATGCLGFMTRHEREDSDEEAPAEEERCDHRFPFWMNAIAAARMPSQPPSTGRPTQFAVRPTPAQPVAGPSQASTSSAGPSTQPSASALQPAEPGPSQQTESQPQPTSAKPLPSRGGSSEVLAAGSQSWEVTTVSQPSTSEPMPSTSEPMPSISKPKPSKFEPMPSIPELMPSTSEPKASTSRQHASTSESTQASSSQSSLAKPSTSASESQPSGSGSQITSTVPTASGPQASASGPQVPAAGVSAAGQSPSPPPRNQRRMFIPSPRTYSTSNTTCPGPQLTFTHTGLRALSVLCPNLTVLELDYCVIDCQTTNIGQFPKTLLRLSLRGTKCFNMEPKTFLFKIQDHLDVLEDIDVSYCSWIEPACMLPLSKISNLLRLSMRECPKLTEFVAYASLATRYGFKKIKVLDLRGSPVGDSEVSALGWLPALEELYLSPSPKTPPVPEHVHYKQDPLPEFKELFDWEETDPEYFRISEAQEEEWTRDEESAQGIRNRFYNCEDPSACTLLERMIAEPVSPMEFSGVYQRFLSAHNCNQPITNPEQHREARNYIQPQPNHYHPLPGYSLVIRSPQQIRDAMQEMRARRSQLPAWQGDPSQHIRARRGHHRCPGGQGQDAMPDVRTRRTSEQPPTGQDANSEIQTRQSTGQQPSVDQGRDETLKMRRPRSSDPPTDAQERDATQQMRRRWSLDHQPATPPGDADKPGTSGQKRKSYKNNDSSSDDDNSPTKVAATTRTIATQTGIGGSKKSSKGKGSKQTKKPKTGCISHRRLYEITFNDLLPGAALPHPRPFEAAANNNNDNNDRQDNDQEPAGPNVEQAMDVDLRPANDIQNPINEDAVPGPSNREPNTKEFAKYATGMRRLLMVAHRAAQNRANLSRIANQAENAQAEAENVAKAEEPKHGNTEKETDKPTDEKEQKNKNPMDVDENSPNDGPNSMNAGPAGPSFDEQLLLYTRNIIYYRRRNAPNPANRPEAGNQAKSAHINRNDGNKLATVIEAENAENETEQATNETEQATNEKEKATNENEKATNETVNATNEAENATNEAENATEETENATNEAEEGNQNTKDAGNQTRNLYNGVPGIDDVPLTPEQEERNRILYENRAHNIVADQSPHLANMDQNLNCIFSNASRAVLNAFAQTDNRQRPCRGIERQRLLQFRQYRRPIVIEDFINSVCNEPRNQRPMPRGVLFAGLIPARLDHSSLISDSSIRRFGRAAGENIVYLGGGPALARGIARPDRSNLRILSVTGFRHVTDSSLMHLASAAPHLQTLDLTGTGVSARASQAFRVLRPDVNLITDHPDDNLGLD